MNMIRLNMIRKPLLGIAALGAVLAMPVAFAQTTTAPQSGTAPAPAPSTAQPAAAAPAAQPKQVTWADLDTDKDGNLSKPEVATVPQLTQVFDQADSNKDGKLTADEYKLFAAKAASSTGGNASGG